MADDDGSAQNQPQARRPGDPLPPPPQPPPISPDEPTARLPTMGGPEARTAQLRMPTVTIEPASARATPDAQTELLLGITNRSDTVNEFIVELDDPTVGWIRIDPPAKNIWPGSRDTYRIVIRPPRSAEVRAGWKEYGLHIRSDGIPGGETTASIRIEVLPFEAVEARLVPRTSSGVTKGRHRIEVRNLGSAPWTASVSALDPEDVLRFETPKQVMAMPAETLNVPVAVRPKGVAFIGSSSKHEFSISLVREAGTPVKVDGVFNQRPFIPATLILPLIAVAVVAVGLALFAAGIIPPRSSPGPTPVSSEGPTTALASPSTPAGESPSAPPSAEVSSSPSVEPSSESSTEPSLDPSTAPDGVDQWAWDRKLRLLTQGNPFDVGKPIGDTQDTTDGRARVQWFEQAVMYQFQDGTLQVVRPPILAGFPLQPISKEPPGTGYPVDQRRGAGGSNVYQVFETQTILCVDTSCILYPKNVFQEWLNDKDRLGQPLDAGTSHDPYTVYQFEQGRIVWDPVRFFVSACDANNVFISGDTDLCSV